METAWEAMLLPPWSLWREIGQNSQPSVLLTYFAGEGVGNTSEAAVLASLVQALLQLCTKAADRVSDWKAPISWNHLFGNSIVEELY